MSGDRGMRIIGLDGKELNGARKILIGAATVIFTLVVIGGVTTYFDVQEMKGNRFTSEDNLQGILDRRREVRASLDSLEARLGAQIELVEERVNGLRLLHR